MNFKRGFIAAFLWALIGIAGPVVAVSVITVVSWQLSDTSEYDRQGDIIWWRMRAAWPLVGVPVYLGLAALATYTPIPKYRYAKTLSILFFTAVPLTWIPVVLGLADRHDKISEHPGLHLNEFLVLLIPPLIISIVLIVIRRTKTLAKPDSTEMPNIDAT